MTTTNMMNGAKMNGKTATAAVCLLGSAALMCNVGRNASSRRSPRGLQALSGGVRVGRSDRDRADALLSRMLSNAEEGDRNLLSANILGEGYYASLGSGACIDSLDLKYDHASNQKSSVDKCAQDCGKNLLFYEHRGFNYDATSKECQCLFDDHKIPRPVQMKASEVVMAPDGRGEIQSTDTALGSFECYKKDKTMLDDPLSHYTAKSCEEDDGEVLDYASFEAYLPATCAEVCGRFSLLETHKGFTVTVEGHCRCLFKNGELPTARKLSNSGADRYDNDENGYTFAARHAQFLTPLQTLCYEKSFHVESEPVENQLAAPADNHVFINEFHFRNYDTNEPFVRVVGPKDSDASKFAVISYLGRDGTIHTQTQLTGTFTSTDSNDFGSIKLDLASTALRKGKQGGDGLALVNTVTNECIQFLSYSSETTYSRSFEAASGICAGKGASVPIPLGITEARDIPVGKSLQLSGTGSTYDSFTWDGPYDASTGTANAAQTLDAF